MDEKRIRKLMLALGIKSPNKTNDWMQASCPFAKWTHEKGTDNNPSWAISIHPEGGSRHRCYSCGEYGDMYSLVMDLRARYKAAGLPFDGNWKEALELSLSDDEDALVEEIDDDPNPIPKGPVIFPETWLQSFQDGHLHPYLKDRGIPALIAHSLEVKYDFQEQRVCFPVRDRYGRLMGMQGRDVTGDASLRYKTYRYNGATNPDVWMGEDKIDWDDAVIITEGPLDYAKAYCCTRQVLASMTSALSWNRLDRLLDIPLLLTMYDLGTGGSKARETIGKWAKSRNRKVHQFLPDEAGGDIGAMSEERIKEVLQGFI